MSTQLITARTHIRLAQLCLEARLVQLERRQRGMLLRNNQITHTKALLGLLEVLVEGVSHDPETWWEDPAKHPF